VPALALRLRLTVDIIDGIEAAVVVLVEGILGVVLRVDAGRGQRHGVDPRGVGLG